MMANFPMYEKTVVPLVDNFNSDNSSMIIITCSNHGFNWVFGEPTVEDLYYAKSEKKYLSSIFDRATSGFLWQIVDNILSDVRAEEEYNVSVIGIDQVGTHDLLKQAYASVFLPRSINDSKDPFALTLPGLTRRPFKSTRGFKILIATALIRAIEKSKLQKHVIIGIRRYPLHDEKIHKAQAIAVSPPLTKSETFIEVTSETPEFRVIILADEVGYPLPIEELAQEAARISTIVEGGKVREASTFATSLPLLLRFSLSAPSVYKIMLIMKSQSEMGNDKISSHQYPTLTTSGGYPSPERVDYQAIDRSKLQKAIADLAASLSMLPRLKNPVQNRPKRENYNPSPTLKSSGLNLRRPGSVSNKQKREKDDKASSNKGNSNPGALNISPVAQPGERTSSSSRPKGQRLIDSLVSSTGPNPDDLDDTGTDRYTRFNGTNSIKNSALNLGDVSTNDDNSTAVAKLKKKLKDATDELESLRAITNDKEIRNKKSRTNFMSPSIDELRSELMEQEDRIAAAEKSMRDSTRLQRSSIQAAKSVIETMSDAVGESAGIDISKLPVAVKKRVEAILSRRGKKIDGDEAIGVLTDAAYGFAVAVNILCAEGDE